MKALDALAVAERDFRALRTARADSCPLSDYSKRERASPFQSSRDSTAPHNTADGHEPPQPIRSVTPFLRSSLARLFRAARHEAGTLDSARQPHHNRDHLVHLLY